jgi:hypothetical protein
MWNGMPGYLSIPKGTGLVPGVDIAERFAKAGIVGLKKDDGHQAPGSLAILALLPGLSGVFGSLTAS